MCSVTATSSLHTATLLLMEKKIAIIYGTWYGQAEKVARRIGDVASIHGFATAIFDVEDPAADELVFDDYKAAIVVGSVHFGHHPKPLTRFAAAKLAALSSIASAFVSVSGAAAALQGDAEAQRYIQQFITVTRWKPDVTLSVAGAVPYSKYGFFLRKMMTFASRVAGRDSDPSRDYEYTNWFTVEQFVRELLESHGVNLREARS